MTAGSASIPAEEEGSGSSDRWTVAGPTEEHLSVANCVTCGAELHPERAEKYDYCTEPECRARNAHPRAIVSIGVNKAADQFLVLDDRTSGEMERGWYRDSGRTSAGRLGHHRSTAAAVRPTSSRRRPAPEGPTDVATWSKEEQNLALAYEITGRLPIEEIAERLGRDQPTVSKMLVAAKAAWLTRNDPHPIDHAHRSDED
jgi:hypothetical protein